MALAWLLVAVVPDAAATTIKLKGGLEYKDVTVLERGTDHGQVQTKFGKVKVPVATIDFVDGKPFPGPQPAVSPAPGRPSAEVESSPPPTPTEEGREVVEEDALAETLEEQAPDPAAAEDLLPPPKAATAAAEPKDLPEDRRDLRFDALLGLSAAIFLLWAAHLVWVQKDLVTRGRRSAGWNTLVALLPGVGLLIISSRARFRDLWQARHRIGRYWRKREFSPWMKKRRAASTCSFSRTIAQWPTGKWAVETGIERARVILEEAIVRRASDMHIEPQEGGYRVRLRVDGVLAERAGFPTADGVRVVSALKSLAQIDVAERRKAQDGRFREDLHIVRRAKQT